MAIKLYQSSDVGAPELSTTTAGSLLTILRACLVEGYGSRTSAGWTMPFSDLPNNQAVFKPLVGDSLRLDDNLDYRWASVLGFKEMTGLDVGTEQYPSSGQLGAGYHYRVYKRYNATSTYSNWFVIAGDGWFYFVTTHDASTPSYPSGFFFGKYDCVNPSFTDGYLLSGYTTTITNVGVTQCYYPLFRSNENMYARRNYQGSQLPVILQQTWSASNFKNPNPFTGSLELDYTSIHDTTPPYIRYGELPSRYKMLGYTSLGYRGGEKFDITGVKYIVAAYSTVVFAFKYDIDVG